MIEWLFLGGVGLLAGLSLANQTPEEREQNIKKALSKQLDKGMKMEEEKYYNSSTNEEREQHAKNIQNSQKLKNYLK